MACPPPLLPTENQKRGFRFGEVSQLLPTYWGRAGRHFRDTDTDTVPKYTYTYSSTPCLAGGSGGGGAPYPKYSSRVILPVALKYTEIWLPYMRL